MSKDDNSIDKRIKQVLKYIKFNENMISAILGVLVIMFAGALIFNYVRTNDWNSWRELTKVSEEVDNQDEQDTDDDKSLYTVQAGDHLWKIAEKVYGSGYNYVDIVEANDLTTTVLTAGQKLILPTVDSREVTTSDEALLSTNTDVVTDATVAGTSTDGEYVTERGDSYWKIAESRLGDGYRWVEIHELNKSIFPDPNIIHAGVKIALPATK
jgi:nucleoid-associated protein YgaU